MCGRFTLTTSWEELQKVFPDFNFESSLNSRFNIAPSQNILALTEAETKSVRELRWGLVPFWSKDEKFGQKLINARSETASEKPSFRDAFKKRRCLILADGFYEWKKEGSQKTPYYIRLKSGKPFCFAGLWETWKQPDGGLLYTGTILTTEANQLVNPIHKRMPVILGNENYDAWMNPKQSVDLLRDLLTQYKSEEMEAYAVSKLVNKPTNDSAQCIVREEGVAM